MKKNQKISKRFSYFNFPEFLENFTNLRKGGMEESINKNNYISNNQEKHVESFSIDSIKVANGDFNIKKNENRDSDDFSNLSFRNDYFLSNIDSNLRKNLNLFSDE